MNRVAKIAPAHQNEYIAKMEKALSCYPVRYILDDGGVEIRQIDDDRFLQHNVWTTGMFADIPQFQTDTQRSFSGKTNKLRFDFHHPNLTLEAKFIAYSKVFDGKWSVPNLIGNQNQSFKLLSQYMAEHCRNLCSFLDRSASEDDWMAWLAEHNRAVYVSSKTIANRLLRYGRAYPQKSYLALFLGNMRKGIHYYLDDRIEWEKDGWDARNLKQYGISHNLTAISYYMYFDAINHVIFREHTKKYLRHKLETHALAWNTARMYMSYLPMFFNFIAEQEPDWRDLVNLERRHIEAFAAHLDCYIANMRVRKNANPQQYKNRGMTIMHKFLSDIQLYGYEIAPKCDVRTLIFPEDKPKIPKKAYDQTDYIPDFVLDQLFTHINDLHPDAVPVVWIMYKTGLRISDALLLKHDCLIKLNGKYWLETDIEKTYVKGHRVPIDNQLASIIASLIGKSAALSNEYNNPEQFVFARYAGSRRGKPMAQYLIREYLNKLAWEKNIVDESGQRYHFTNHAFRHTYAVKMLNGGADIFTIQELLAHASPEMTMRYARLMDDTKRQAFDQVVATGIFSFSADSTLVETPQDIASPEILHMLWTNHKLEAIDTPFGTCLQRAQGKCAFAKQPPCLTCNGGSPCKDLCVGAFEGDIEKYDVLISSTTALIEQARRYGRQQTIAENEALLEIYRKIQNTIRSGNIIYSRMERLTQV